MKHKPLISKTEKERENYNISIDMHHGGEGLEKSIFALFYLGEFMKKTPPTQPQINLFHQLTHLQSQLTHGVEIYRNWL